MNEDGWHIQIKHGEWVRWGYVDADMSDERKSQVGIHIEPAFIVIAAGDEVCQIDFKLPKRSIGDSVPQVVERKTCWGWRFKSNCLIHDTGWNLVDTKEQVLEDAAKWVDNKLNVRNHDRPEWLDYLKDVREIEPLKNPLLDIVNNA